MPGFPKRCSFFDRPQWCIKVLTTPGIFNRAGDPEQEILPAIFPCIKKLRCWDRSFVEPLAGIEPATCTLRMCCSARWATVANLKINNSILLCIKSNVKETMQILWYICGTNFMPRQSLGKTLYRRPAANSKPVHISVSHLPSSRSWTPSHSCNCTKKPEIRLFCNSIFFMNIMICIFIHCHEYLYFFPLPRPHIAQIYHMHIVFYNRTIYQFAHIFCLRISQTSTPAKIHVHNFA